MWKAALDSADYTLTRLENKLDELMGRTARLVVGRYTALIFIGAPLAWALNGFHWGPAPALGLTGGVLFYALVDVCRAATTAFRRR